MSQQSLISKSLEAAEIGLGEWKPTAWCGHLTGTGLGDPIEVITLANIFSFIFLSFFHSIQPFINQCFDLTTVRE